MTEKIVLGIVGGGFGKRVLLPVCLKHPLVKLKWLAVENHIPTDVPSSVMTSLRWNDIIEDSEVRAVLVATPHDMHAEQVSAFLGAGKHVLCEKPLALNAEQAMMLAKQCKEATLVGVMDYNFRFIPPRNLFRSLISDGLIGAPKLIRLSFFRNDFPQWPSQWYYESRRGGGALFATGSHLIDAVHWLTRSEVRLVNAVISFEGEIDTGFSAMMETDSGCVCFVDVSHQIPGAGSHTIEAHGECGSLFLNSEGQVMWNQNGDIQRFAIEDQHRFGFGGSIWDDNPRLQPAARVVDIFINCILDSSVAIDLDFQSAVRTQVVMEAIRISHLEKRRVDLSMLMSSYKTGGFKPGSGNTHAGL